jgi:hypothetical protein
MKNFLRKNWTLILVGLYIIFPDLVPGPFDDAALLLTERVLSGYINKKKEQKAKKKQIKSGNE